jgi:hypothetical protein
MVSQLHMQLFAPSTPFASPRSVAPLLSGSFTLQIAAVYDVYRPFGLVRVLSAAGKPLLKPLRLSLEELSTITQIDPEAHLWAEAGTESQESSREAGELDMLDSYAEGVERARRVAGRWLAARAGIATSVPWSARQLAYGPGDLVWLRLCELQPGCRVLEGAPEPGYAELKVSEHYCADVAEKIRLEVIKLFDA